MLALSISMSTAAEDKYDDLDRAALLRIIQEQSREIEDLKARIAAIEAEDQPVAADIADGVGIGELFKQLPEKLIPAKGESWQTYEETIGKWIEANLHGQVIETDDSTGQLFVVDKLTPWRASTQGRTAGAYLTIRQAVQVVERYQPERDANGNISKKPIYAWSQMNIRLGRDRQLQVGRITAIISDPDLYRQLEKVKDSPFTVSGTLQEASVSSGIQGDAGWLSVVLEDNPKITPSRKRVLQRKNAESVPPLK
jgi:hypothetical protein